MGKNNLTQKNEVNMLEGSLLDKIIIFALPLAGSSILQQLFNSCDTAVVGNFASSQDMAAVGANASVICLIVSLFVGLSVGANVSIGRLIGHNERKRINTAITTIMILAVFSGILLLVLGLILASPVLRLMKTPDDVLYLAIKYLQIYSLGMPFIMIYDFGAAILRSRGDSRRPFFALLFSGLVNVSLNLILVIVFKMGVAGVAIATVISNAISSIFIIVFLIKGDEDFRLNVHELKFDKEFFLEVLRIGVPSGIQGMIFSFSNSIIQTHLNSFNSTIMAGSTASQNIETIGYYAINSFNQSATTFMSQNYAAGKKDRCRKVFRYTLLCGLLSSLAIDILLLIFHGPVLSLFSSDKEVVQAAYIRMIHVISFQCIASTYEISGSNLRGMGYSATPTILTIFGCVGFRLFWIYFIFPLSKTYEMLLNVYPVSWCITGSLVMGAYFMISKKKLKVDVKI